MSEPFIVKKVAVLGAGVMGAQIAAHCINAGIETLLYDLPAKEGDLNGIVNKAILNLTKLKPTPLAVESNAGLLQAKNYEKDLAELKDCDLIIEAIAERLDWKEDLYKKISPFLSKNAILVSNTSGLSINDLASVLPAAHRKQFCGVHFFNPPRYMHLAELIPAKDTNSKLLDNLETWLTSYLGKGVIRAKDTPNFIANRIGVFSLLITLHYAEKFNLKLDEVDAITGPLLGRPKSATFRTMDVVGLDTMKHVVNTMKEQLKDDPWHRFFNLPQWLNALIEKGALGQKTGAGIYCKKGKEIEVLDLEAKDYRPSKAKASEELLSIMKIKDSKERMQKLIESNDKQAQFLSAYFLSLFQYSAYHLADIADNVRDVDLALRYGFGWQEGPFETWQLAGTKNIIDAIKKHNDLIDVLLPAWLFKLDDFYSEEGAYSPSKNQMVARSKLPVYEKQFFKDKVLKAKEPELKVIYENEGVKLLDFKDNVVLLSFKSKANTISQAVLDGLHEAITKAEQHSQGLIIHQNDANNFSSGADLRGVSSLIKNKDMKGLETMISQFQDAAMRLKHSFIPVVAALRGRALGGGLELVLHCDAVVAAFESYPGLVEVGVGLLPAGGGCKEMALRASHRAADADLMPFIQSAFKQIAMAFVAGSAVEAKQKGYLGKKQSILMHSNEVLLAALAEIKALNATNYLPPMNQKFKVAGIEGAAILKAGLVNWLEGGFISEHDYLIASEIAYVLCGGNLNQGEMVDENWLLHLEREAFVKLASTEKTEARINYLLETGKPLRN